MKTDNPRFVVSSGNVWCDDCPFTDDDGNMVHKDLCGSNPCPTADTYAEACELADTATKRAVKEYGR